MKIAYIIPECDMATDTHFYYNCELLKAISREMDLYLIVERNSAASVTYKGFGWHYIQRFRWPPLRFAEIMLVALFLRIKGVSVFWTHYSYYGALASLFATRVFWGKSFYWNCGMPWLYEIGSLKNKVFRFIVRHSVLVTGTEGMKQMYMRRFNLLPEKIKVMPNWVDAGRFKEWSGKKKEARNLLGIRQEKRVVIFLHHLSRRKGAHRIVPVAKMFRNDPNVLFLVAGSGPYENILMGDIHNSKLGNVVRFEGSILNREVPKYMAAADVLFMPSEEEGFPHVLLEAMASGLPFVAGNAGGVKEIVPADLGRFVVSGDNEFFADAIDELLDDRLLRQSISKKIILLASEYSMAVSMKIFQELVAGR